MDKLKIVVSEQGHLKVVSEDSPTEEIYKNMDLGQVISTYRLFGYRHVREDDTDWLIRDEDWEAINEVVDPQDNVAYREGEQDGT